MNDQDVFELVVYWDQLSRQAPRGRKPSKDRVAQEAPPATEAREQLQGPLGTWGPSGRGHGEAVRDDVSAASPDRKLTRAIEGRA